MDDQTYRSKAKEVYLALRRSGNVFSLSKFANQTEQILGKAFGPRVIEMWALEDGWEGVDIVLDRESKEVKETINMLQTALSLFRQGETVKDRASYAKAIYSIVSKAPVEIVEEHKNDIQYVRDELYSGFVVDAGDMPAATSSAYIQVWAELGKLLSRLSLEYVEEGFDPDEYLLFGDDNE